MGTRKGVCQNGDGRPVHARGYCRRCYAKRLRCGLIPRGASHPPCVACGKPYEICTFAHGRYRACRMRVWRAAQVPKPQAGREFVKELSTGVCGYILRRVRVAPAAIAYVVRFNDGREKRVLTSEVEKVV